MNRKKIIRAVTVSQSLTFCRDVMIDMRKRGFEMIAVTSPGPELERMRNEDGFRCIAVPMERHISIGKDLKSLWNLIIRKRLFKFIHGRYNTITFAYI